MVTEPVKISFNEHVQPILSEYCYHCHGPDSGTREPKKAPLRLDRMEDAFVPREDGKPVILKGNPAESMLVKRLHEKDPDSIMPPPKSHKTLKPQEIALLERWIEQGAEYEPHWSFAQVKKPEIPAAGEGWAANPIDRFIAEKLDSSALKPNPPEDSARFYRRLHLDLTGLPPAPEAIEAFKKSAIESAAASAARHPHLAVRERAGDFLAAMGAGYLAGKHSGVAPRSLGDLHQQKRPHSRAASKALS